MCRKNLSRMPSAGVWLAPIVVFALWTGDAGPTAGQTSETERRQQMSQSDPEEGVHQARGTVIDLDVAGGWVLIHHAPIEGFMDAMTMFFQVSDPALLEGVKAGDGVRFTLRGEDMTILELTVDPEAKVRAPGVRAYG